MLALLALALVLLAAFALRDRVEPSRPRIEPDAPAEVRARTEVPANEHPEHTEEAEHDRTPAAPLVSSASDETAARPAPALRAAFERESPDATAHVAEARIRAIYGAEPNADTILRDVRCTRSVCKADLRWSPELNKPYNDALNNALKEFSRDIDLTPNVALGGPEMPIPMTLFIARPGFSVESLLAEQRTAPAPAAR